jgi:hypothetical protein
MGFVSIPHGVMINMHVFAHESGNGHTMCFYSFLHLLVASLESGAQAGVTGREPVALMFDSNDEYGPGCLDMFSRQRQNNPQWRDWLKSICFADDDYHRPLQAADILVWLLSQNLKTAQITDPSLLSNEQLAELLSIGRNGLSGAALSYDAASLQVVDRGIIEGKSLQEIVNIGIGRS